MRPDAHQCLEDLNNSRLHSSGRHENTSGCQLEFEKFLDFLCRHVYGKTAAFVRTSGQHRSDEVLNKARCGEELQPSRRGPYYGNYMHQSCNRPNARATSSGCGLNMDSVKLVMERKLHSCPF
jgi:hypothetical protein